MAWNFEISWVLGKAIPTPDTTSRQQQATTGTDDDLPAAPAALRLDKEASPDLAGDEEFAAVARAAVVLSPRSVRCDPWSHGART